jgi:vacuolar-type H+-ATPase subunit E/Vma4
MTVKNKSAVEEILRGLEEEAEKQKKAIIRDAKKEARRILAEAKESAKEEYSRIITQKTQKLQAEVNRIIRNAEVEREKTLSEVRVRFLNNAFKLTLKELERIRGTERYEEGLKRIIEEALSEFGERWKADLTPEILADIIAESSPQGLISHDEAISIAKGLIEKGREAIAPELLIVLQSLKRKSPDVIIQCNPRDRTAVERIIHDKGLNAIVETNSDITGGIVLYSSDRKIVIDSSFEARLKKVRRLFSKELIEMFF